VLVVDDVLRLVAISRKASRYRQVGLAPRAWSRHARLRRQRRRLPSLIMMAVAAIALVVGQRLVHCRFGSHYGILRWRGRQHAARPMSVGCRRVPKAQTDVRGVAKAGQRVVGSEEMLGFAGRRQAAGVQMLPCEYQTVPAHVLRVVLRVAVLAQSLVVSMSLRLRPPLAASVRQCRFALPVR